MAQDRSTLVKVNVIRIISVMSKGTALSGVCEHTFA
jgi:hypothetical protein